MSDAPVTRFADFGRHRIAFQVFGKGPRDIVFTLGAFNNIDVFWEHPASAAFLRGLGRLGRCVAFDPLGTGASDRVPADQRTPGSEAHLVVDAVLAAAEVDCPVLFGMLDGAAAVAQFAASHPERTSALILANASARLRQASDYAIGHPPDVVEGLLEVVESTWGTEAWSALSYPSLADDSDFTRWFARYQRSVGTASAMVDALRNSLALDLRGVLPLISAPTLILHRADYTLVPATHGKYLADHIPGAVYVEVSGGDGLLLKDEQLTLGHIEEFLTGTRSTTDASTVLAGVLVTDIVGSTGRAAEVGDRAWAQVLDRHDEVTRRYVARYGGTVVKSTGDGVLATFPGVARLVRCGTELLAALADEGIMIRAAGHAGDVELRGNDVAGMTVHIASRIAAVARPGEMLVSSTIKDLVAASGLSFEDRGQHDLKGVPGAWHLYAAEP